MAGGDLAGAGWPKISEKRGRRTLRSAEKLDLGLASSAMSQQGLCSGNLSELYGPDDEDRYSHHEDDGDQSVPVGWVWMLFHGFGGATRCGQCAFANAWEEECAVWHWVRGGVRRRRT